MLYEEIEENQDNIVDDIFRHLLKEEIITEKELVAILEKHNNYLVGFYEKNEQVIEDVSKMIKAINSAYRMSKINFIWKKKMQQSKKTVATRTRRSITSNFTFSRRNERRTNRRRSI